MTKTIKLNYDSTAIDAINTKISGAKTTIEETTKEIEAIHDQMDDVIKDVANDKAGIDDVTALEDRILDLERKQKINLKVLDGFEYAKREGSTGYAQDMHVAHEKAFEELQAEYNKAYTEILIPARKAYVEALAELGSINQNAKNVNAEFSREYDKTHEGEKREAFRFNKELNRKGTYNSYFYTGKNESEGFGISENTQRQLHETGNVNTFQ
ncbi:hypothetical protein FPV24_00540 [Carnobacterium sp. PL24RED07]|uniref:hypothetical protein n=1 Tax=unclassified Carnobacterium TaxID=257487 RepID=UPI0011EC92BA|nr:MULTISPECIES: hypothetical protein [unclassified Carnobacterium]KAF3303628.1 hypothetical protein FPV22_00540 [Carnobacterium sp. PL26RED25]KAF3307146.1 hypothetical protein FPV24_00540 [Carnobacterium sp. PL24RED07]